MSNDDRRLSPSRLATYGQCPRQYEYDKVWQVETPEESRRYLDRGLIYHAAIEQTCDAVRARPSEFTDSEIQELAIENTKEEWDARAKRAEYQSDAQFEHDRALVLSAMESFFAGDGLEHARNSVATEQDVTCDRGEYHLKGRADHIVGTEDGLHIYDYKGSYGNIVSGRSADTIPEHRAGESFNAKILKSLFQAAIYIEGAKNLEAYEDGMDVGFSFYALLKHKDRVGHPDGLQVDVSGAERDVTWIYESYHDDIWALIEACYDGIKQSEFQPKRFAEIREHVCDDCEYRAMCGDYLNAEVRIDE